MNYNHQEVEKSAAELLAEQQNLCLRCMGF